MRVLDVRFTCLDFPVILTAMNERIREGKPGGYISITNTESAYHARRILSHREYINGACFSCCDGVAVVLGARLSGLRIPRLHGPDLMLRSCEYGVSRGWRHFAYGGREHVPELLSGKLAERFPGFLSVGAYSPPFRALTREEDDAIVRMINGAAPDILWVGLGLLKQEKWIKEHLGRITAPWMIGVGAAFDFLAGTVKRAPMVFRRAGLEWLYRVAFEPRMLRRNLYSLRLFVDLLFNSASERRRRQRAEEAGSHHL